MIDDATYTRIMENVQAKLVERYSEPHRTYHGIHHLNEMLTALRIRFHHNTPVSNLIIWYHDAIYDPKQSDNEEKSADLAVTELKKFVQEPDLNTIYNGILLTKHLFPSHCISQPFAAIVELDLSILAHEWMYWHYARAIREEYNHIPDDKYISGRVEFLEKMRSRKKLFIDNTVADKLAETNMTKEIEFLKKNNLKFA